MRRLVFSTLVFLGCAGRAEPAPPDPPPPTAEAALGPDPEPVLPPTPPEPPADPAPSIVLAHEVSRYGVVSLSLSNRTEAPTSLSMHLVVEREVDGEYQPASDLGAFDLEPVGDGACAELASGAELRGDWACLRGDAPLATRDCAPASAGTYRFVTTSCDGRSRTEGEPFVYP